MKRSRHKRAGHATNKCAHNNSEGAAIGATIVVAQLQRLPVCYLSLALIFSLALVKCQFVDCLSETTNLNQSEQPVNIFQNEHETSQKQQDNSSSSKSDNQLQVQNQSSQADAEQAEQANGTRNRNAHELGLAELNPDASDTVPLYMQHMTIILCILHLSVFVTGLVGNSLVCLSVYRNKSLQTITNYYIVNLAVADFLVILICLPPTVYWDLTLTWDFGLVSCKLVLYLQSISVSVSVLTLTCISVDRWYAICRPLKFSSSKSRAKRTIALIWIASLLIGSPDVIFLKTKTLYEEAGDVYTDCTYSWPESNTKIHQLCIVTLLFVLPFVFMIISYSQIVNVLWRNETMAESMQNSFAALEDEGVSGAVPSSAATGGGGGNFSASSAAAKLMAAHKRRKLSRTRNKTESMISTSSAMTNLNLSPNPDNNGNNNSNKNGGSVSSCSSSKRVGMLLLQSVTRCDSSKRAAFDHHHPPPPPSSEQQQQPICFACASKTSASSGCGGGGDSPSAAMCSRSSFAILRMCPRQRHSSPQALPLPLPPPQVDTNHVDDVCRGGGGGGQDDPQAHDELHQSRKREAHNKSCASYARDDSNNNKCAAPIAACLQGLLIRGGRGGDCGVSPPRARRPSKSTMMMRDNEEAEAEAEVERANMEIKPDSVVNKIGGSNDDDDNDSRENIIITKTTTTTTTTASNQEPVGQYDNEAACLLAAAAATVETTTTTNGLQAEGSTTTSDYDQSLQIQPRRFSRLLSNGASYYYADEPSGGCGGSLSPRTGETCAPLAAAAVAVAVAVAEAATIAAPPISNICNTTNYCEALSHDNHRHRHHHHHHYRQQQQQPPHRRAAAAAEIITSEQQEIEEEQAHEAPQETFGRSLGAKTNEPCERLDVRAICANDNYCRGPAPRAEATTTAATTTPTTLTGVEDGGQLERRVELNGVEAAAAAAAAVAEVLSRRKSANLEDTAVCASRAQTTADVCVRNNWSPSPISGHGRQAANELGGGGGGQARDGQRKDLPVKWAATTTTTTTTAVAACQRGMSAGKPNGDKDAAAVAGVVCSCSKQRRSQRNSRRRSASAAAAAAGQPPQSCCLDATLAKLEYCSQSPSKSPYITTPTTVGCARGDFYGDGSNQDVEAHLTALLDGCHDRARDASARSSGSGGRSPAAHRRTKRRHVRLRDGCGCRHERARGHSNGNEDSGDDDASKHEASLGCDGGNSSAAEQQQRQSQNQARQAEVTGGFTKKDASGGGSSSSSRRSQASSGKRRRKTAPRLQPQPQQCQCECNHKSQNGNQQQQRQTRRDSSAGGLATLEPLVRAVRRGASFAAVDRDCRNSRLQSESAANNILAASRGRQHQDAADNCLASASSAVAAAAVDCEPAATVARVRQMGVAGNGLRKTEIVGQGGVGERVDNDPRAPTYDVVDDEDDASSKLCSSFAGCTRPAGNDLDDDDAEAKRTSLLFIVGQQQRRQRQMESSKDEGRFCYDDKSAIFEFEQRQTERILTRRSSSNIMMQLKEVDKKKSAISSSSSCAAEGKGVSVLLSLQRCSVPLIFASPKAVVFGAATNIAQLKRATREQSPTCNKTTTTSTSTSNGLTMCYERLPVAAVTSSPLRLYHQFSRPLKRSKGSCLTPSSQVCKQKEFSMEEVDEEEEEGEKTRPIDAVGSPLQSEHHLSVNDDDEEKKSQGGGAYSALSLRGSATTAVAAAISAPQRASLSRYDAGSSSAAAAAAAAKSINHDEARQMPDARNDVSIHGAKSRGRRQRGIKSMMAAAAAVASGSKFLYMKERFGRLVPSSLLEAGASVSAASSAPSPLSLAKVSSAQRAKAPLEKRADGSKNCNTTSATAAVVAAQEAAAAAAGLKSNKCRVCHAELQALDQREQWQQQQRSSARAIVSAHASVKATASERLAARTYSQTRAALLPARASSVRSGAACVQIENGGIYQHQHQHHPQQQRQVQLTSGKSSSLIVHHNLKPANTNNFGQNHHQAPAHAHAHPPPPPTTAHSQQQQQSSSNPSRFYKLIESRKKAAKMLIVIVIMFGLCYLPVHLINLLRYTTGLPQNDITTIASLVSHWLCYFNSAVNPLIYNFMSAVHAASLHSS